MKRSPKYLQIADFFQKQIESGILSDGELLPSEADICNTFSASHMTVAKALNTLASSGYLKRTPGVGTTVSHGYKATLRKALTSFESISSLVEEAGMTPSAKLLSYQILAAKDLPGTAEKLMLAENDFVHFFVRARYCDEALLCISYTYISQRILPAIDVSKLLGSFDEYVQNIGIQRSHGYTEYCATLPTEEQAKIIGNDRTPLLKQTILWYAANAPETPFELTYHFFIGDKYTLAQDQRLIIST